MIGFTGSFISLAMSKFMAKRSTGCQNIEDSPDPEAQWIVSRVRAHAEAAGIGMPEVCVFPANEPNAFATGMRRDSALVAVSSGLLRGMHRNEVDAVIGHEIAHIANGDMVTLTLIQGVVNTFVVFFSRIAGHSSIGSSSRPSAGTAPATGSSRSSRSSSSASSPRSSSAGSRASASSAQTPAAPSTPARRT